jgi:hypothetical protein
MEILPAEDVVVRRQRPRFEETEGAERIRAPQLLAGLAGLVMHRENETLAGMNALRPVRRIPSTGPDEFQAKRPREHGGLG